MRKFTFYILILVAIIGLFSPVIQVKAATEIPAATSEGKCVYKEDSSFSMKKGDIASYDPSYGKTPEEFCGLNTQYLEWIPTGATTPSAPITAYQQCINKGSTYEDCKILAGAPATAPNLTPAATPAQEDLKYTLLAPLPCNTPGIEGCDSDKLLKTFDPTNADDAFGKYLNLMIAIFIGICAVLAVIMIVAGGIEYMTTELISSKEAGKERIKNAILGLLLALGAWTLLNQINPDLLDVSLESLKDVTVEVTAQDFALSPSKYIVPLGKTGKASGTNCDENEVAASNQTANASLSNAQIHTLACVGGIETGCKSIKNYAWGKGSSAYGPFQILLQGNADCFESNICRQAAGVSGSLNCAAGFLNGNPIPNSPIVEQCKKAANNFTCSVSAAACLIKKHPDYSDWNANPNLSKCK